MNLTQEQPRSSDAARLEDAGVIAAVQEYMAALETGGRPNRAEFLARYPTIAPALADVLDGLEFMHSAAPRMLPAAEPDDAEVQAGTPLGDFRLLREVGRGGMGVVYEAEQLSLGRRVALKVLPFASTLDAKQLQRFKNESQAAAHLHHQHIVPVYATGCERGVHYYAMQFIEGRTLAQVIEELRGPAPSETASAEPTGPYEPGVQPTPEAATRESAKARTTQNSANDPAYFRTVAQLGVQAAEALEHAHSLGIVHRDIKPANLLVENCSLPTAHCPLHLWITDFGLAQIQSNASLTLTGDLVGTVRYMSPEQTLAKRVLLDHRTDIYSLGVTLYELLALRPAFDGRSRHEIMHQIAFEEPRPPRRLNKAVPAELETIVLKAMEKNPTERYATAMDMADDLQRFLKDEPIRAKRPGLLLRARKWGRRHPAISWSALVLVSLSFAALTLFLWRDKQLTDKANAELVKEQERTQRAWEAEARRRIQTRRALDAVFSRVIEDWLLEKKKLEAEHKEFLEEALKDYKEFAEDTGQDEATRAGVAGAHFRIGQIQMQLGQTAEAQRAFTQCKTLYAELVREFSDSSHYRALYALSLHNLGTLLARDEGRREEAVSAFREAIPILDKVVAESPKVTRRRRQLADCLHDLGVILLDQGRYADAEAHLRKGLALQAKLVEEVPTQAFYRARLVGLHTDLAAVLAARGRWADAEGACREGHAIGAKLIADAPNLAEAFETYGRNCTKLGLVLMQKGMPTEAEPFLRAGVATTKKLATSLPNVPQHRDELAGSLQGLAQVQAALNRKDQAKASYREAIAVGEKLVRDFPKVPRFGERLGMSYHNLARLLGVRPEAEMTHRKGLVLFEKLVAEFPIIPRYRHALATSLNALAMLLREVGRRDEAEGLFDRALATVQKLVSEFGVDPEYRQRLLEIQSNRAAMSIDQGRWPEAEVAQRRAVDVAEKLVADFPAKHQFQQRLAAVLNNLGLILKEQDKHGEAAATFDRALAIQRKLLERFSDQPGYRLDIAMNQINRGSALENLHRYDEADSAFQEARTLYAKLASDYPKSPTFRRGLGMALNNHALLLEKMSRPADAEELNRKAVAVREKLVADAPTVPIYATDLGGSYRNLGDLMRGRDDSTEALAWYGKAIETLRKALTQDRRLFQARDRLRDVYFHRAQVLEKLSRHAEAVKDWDEAIPLTEGKQNLRYRINRALCLVRAGKASDAVTATMELAQTPGMDGDRVYDLARVCSLASAAVEGDAKRKEHYAMRAVALLRDAFVRGFGDMAHLKKDTDLDPIRSREDYKKLIVELESKTDR